MKLAPFNSQYSTKSKIHYGKISIKEELDHALAPIVKTKNPVLSSFYITKEWLKYIQLN
jgi:hypothetical protein